ncbi:TonB-dependent receptor [soil metagenome]
MHIILAALILVGSAAPALAQQAASGPRAYAERAVATATVWGQIRSEQTGAPLRFAIVEVVGSGAQPIASATDSSGVYVLRNVPVGRRLLRATHIDHAPNEVEILVVSDRQHVVDFALSFRPLRLNAVTADAGGRGLPAAMDTVAASIPDLGPASARVHESTPGVAELGMSEAARDVPGHSPIDPADVLYVRGGAADLKLVLLNGAPVYAPFHVGGLIDALDDEVLRSATLHAGGAPARFDGGLSYVMEIETRSGRMSPLRGELGVDLLGARGIVEGFALPNASFIVSGRSIHGLGTSALSGSAFPYGYGDALARADIVVSPSHIVTLTGFWNDEHVQLDTVGAQREAASWGNRAGSLRYRGTLGEHEVLGTVSHGRFRTLLPLGGVRPLMTEGTAERSRVAFDVERTIAGGRVFWGGSFDRIDFEHRAFPQGQPRDSAIVASTTGGDIAGGYAEAAFSVLPRLRLRAGLRADAFSSASGIYLAPRASATLLLTDRAMLSLSAGQYRQYVRAPEQSLVFLGDVVSDSAGGPVLTVAEASHLVLGLSQDFGEGIRLDLEGFFKQFDGLQSSATSSTAASGVDIWLRRTTGVVTGWFGYSLSWVWAVESGSVRPTQSFSGRHLISAGVAGPVLAGTHFDVRFSYGAGLPYTAIPEPESASPLFGVARRPRTPALDESPQVTAVAAEPDDPYLRLDARVSHIFEGNVRSFEFQLMPYLKVINALNRRDAIFYHYQRDVGQAQPLDDLPVVPIIGLEWRF